MATVTGFTKTRMLAIENSTVVGGFVDENSHLILVTRDDTEIDAGYVKGDPATALMQLAETEGSVDLTLTGAGTPANPWVLKGDVASVPAATVAAGTPAFQQISNDLTVKAYLDPAYRGWGPAKVRFLSGGALSTTAYEWDSAYIPHGSRVVVMRRVGTTWRILSQDDGGRVPLPLLNGWRYYGDTTFSRTFEVPRAAKLASGIVILGGLIRKTTAIADGEVIAQLPVGMRPDYDLIFGVNNNDGSKYILVKANGDITAGTALVSGFISLENISFPAAGVATWTFIEAAGTGGTQNVFVNSWSEFNTAQYGRARFWKDPWGFVWTQGVIKGGTTTHNTQMFTMDAANASYKTQHFATAANNALGIIGTGTNEASLRYRNGSAGGSWVSITGPAILTNDAWANNPWNAWTSNTLFGNSWTGFVVGSDYINGLAELRREDGLCMFHGMLSGGTLSAPIRLVSDELFPPTGNRIFHTAAGDARGRVDVRSMFDLGSEMPGALTVVNGSNSWVAFDSLKYVP